ncbi:MAG: hypothetical protein LBC56_06065 [Oscillospiraceae bacterium]|jgi:hypothetical protein|nr:hypothetical protein [Oscillospiraceae bacterium]
MTLKKLLEGYIELEGRKKLYEKEIERLNQGRLYGFVLASQKEELYQ